MFALIMAIVCGASYSFVMKLTEVNNGNRYAATVFNYIFAIFICAAMMEEKKFFYDTPGGYFALGFSLFHGAIMVAGMLYARKCIRANGAPMQTTFFKLGILIPMFLSFLLFGETPSILQLLGIIIVVVGVAYMNLGGGETHIRSYTLLLVIFVVGGIVEFNFKLYGIYGDMALQPYFLFCAFIVAAVISTGLMLHYERKFDWKDVALGCLTGIPNCFMSHFSILALADLPSYLVYPTVCVGTIIVVNIVNVVIFKEKPTRQELIATVIIMLALVFLNI